MEDNMLSVGRNAVSQVWVFFFQREVLPSCARGRCATFWFSTFPLPTPLHAKYIIKTRKYQSMVVPGGGGGGEGGGAAHPLGKHAVAWCSRPV